MTQTQVSIDSTSCSPRDVSALVLGQVGFEVVLLDSKCYPILHNDATTVFDYWKSTRKILAASKAAYEKLTGKAFSHTLDLVSQADNVTPTSKRRHHSENLSDKIELVQASIDRLAKKFDFLSSFGKTFECIICRDICKKPVVAGCCRRVIGCDACISRWDTQNSTCPLCLCELSQRWQLRGLDDMLLLANNIIYVKIRTFLYLQRSNLTVVILISNLLHLFDLDVANNIDWSLTL